jgi:hypothetical protein
MGAGFADPALPSGPDWHHISSRCRSSAELRQSSHKFAPFFQEIVALVWPLSFVTDGMRECLLRDLSWVVGRFGAPVS